MIFAPNRDVFPLSNHAFECFWGCHRNPNHIFWPHLQLNLSQNHHFIIFDLWKAMKWQKLPLLCRMLMPPKGRARPRRSVATGRHVVFKSCRPKKPCGPWNCGPVDDQWWHCFACHRIVWKNPDIRGSLIWSYLICDSVGRSSTSCWWWFPTIFVMFQIPGPAFKWCRCHTL